MPVKITSRLTLRRNIERANSKSSRNIKSKIVKLIDREYERGQSPVKFQRKFKKYAPSTVKIKRSKGQQINPVNLKDTGKLRASLKAIQKTRRTIVLLFQGARNRRIASYHNFGTDNMPKRVMLPSRPGQEFKTSIVREIFKIVQREFDKIR
jgi:phage gpG-like protein